jgi:hypothetical protein
MPHRRGQPKSLRTYSPQVGSGHPVLSASTDVATVCRDRDGILSSTRRLVHLANISYRVGRTLHFDAASYSVRGDAEANRLFRREYRKPFVVPERV